MRLDAQNDEDPLPDGVGSATIVDRLNREGVPGTGGKRWNKTPVDRILQNERYLGRQIWGQTTVDREPSTGRIIQRKQPRQEWKVIVRTELRIVSDDLWGRVQATRKEIREAVAPKRNLARGKSGKHHSKIRHLFVGFAKCALCGGTMSTVSGGSGSPRLGCRRSWNDGTSSCPNRLTIRIKVAEPKILAKLQAELLLEKNIAYIAKPVEREAKKALAAGSKDSTSTRKLLDQEKRKLQNLLAALEGGSEAPSSVLKAIAAREKTIAQLEHELEAATSRPQKVEVGDLTNWVESQLGDLASLLKEDVPRVKSEFRRLNLALKFTPIEAQPRAHFVVDGQCDLSALAFSSARAAARGQDSVGWVWRAGRQSAPVDSLGEGAVQRRTPILRFRGAWLAGRRPLPSRGRAGERKVRIERVRGRLQSREAPSLAATMPQGNST